MVYEFNRKCAHWGRNLSKSLTAACEAMSKDARIAARIEWDAEITAANELFWKRDVVYNLGCRVYDKDRSESTAFPPCDVEGYY